MRRLAVAGGTSLVLVLTTVALSAILDSAPVRLLGLIFLQYPAMLAAYVAGDAVSTSAIHVAGIVLAWAVWTVAIYAALSLVDARKGADRLPKHA